MPTEVRVLGATALFTAVLVFIAWWMGQHHDALVQHVHEAQTVTVGVLPSFSWSEPPRALPTMTPDAGLGAVPDAGDEDAMEGTEAELAAILIPAICNRRRNECGCTEYPSRFAPEEERIAATTCEQDTLRDFRSWWRNNIHGRVVVVAEPELSALLDERVDCSGFQRTLDDFLRADAVAGDACSFGRCRDGSLCEEGRCQRYQQQGESCLSEDGPFPSLADWNALECASGLHCVAERCEVDPLRGSIPRRCPLGSFTVWDATSSRCIPNRTPCGQSSECGDGYCVGASTEHRCVHDAAIDVDLGDHAPMSCAGVDCPRGHACTYPTDRCLPVVGVGERCEDAVCARYARCEVIVPGGGHCIARVCLTSHPFGSVGE